MLAAPGSRTARLFDLLRQHGAHVRLVHVFGYEGIPLDVQGVRRHYFAVGHFKKGFAVEWVHPPLALLPIVVPRDRLSERLRAIVSEKTGR